MTTPNSTTERGRPSDDEIGAAWDTAKARMSHDPYTPKEAFWAGALFAQSRQASAQGGERVEPPIERVMGEACSICHGSGVGLDGKACPFAPHKQVTYKLRATPPATSGMKESLVGDAELLNWLERQDLEETCMGHAVDGRHDGEYYINVGLGPFYGKTLREALDAAIRAGRKG